MSIWSARAHGRRATRFAIVVVLIAVCRGSAAQPSLEDRYRADKLLQDARWLAHQGNVAEACRKFEESQRRDPRAGTLLELATCHQREGKTAKAWRELTQARELARGATSAYTRTYFESRIAPAIAALEPELSRITVTLAPGDPETSLELTLDGDVFGKESLGTPIPVDPGDHSLTASAPGRETWETTIVVAPRQHDQSVLVPVLPRTVARASVPVTAADVPTPTRRPPTQPGAPSPTGLSVGVTTVAVFQQNESQSTLVGVVNASYNVTAALAPFVRLAGVFNKPAAQPEAWGFANPALGATLGIPLGRFFKLGALLGVAIPVGSAGGDHPDPAVAAAMRSGLAGGGAVFASSYFDVFPGLRLTLSAAGFTLQAKSTLNQLFRVRGAAPDETVTLLNSGASAAYAIVPVLSVFAQFAEARFLSTPSFVAAAPAAREDEYLGGGVALNLKPGRTVGFQPSVLYARAIDLPKRDRNFQLIEIALAVTM